MDCRWITKGRLEIEADGWRHVCRCGTKIPPSVTLYDNGNLAIYIQKNFEKYSVSNGFTEAYTYNEPNANSSYVVRANKYFTSPLSKITFKCVTEKDGDTDLCSDQHSDAKTYASAGACIYNGNPVYRGNHFSCSNGYNDGSILNYAGSVTLNGVATPVSPKFSYTHPNNTSVTKKFFKKQIITVDPNEFKYEDRGDGYYYITLNLDRIDNVSVSNTLKVSNSPSSVESSRFSFYSTDYFESIKSPKLVTINVPKKEAVEVLIKSFDAGWSNEFMVLGNLISDEDWSAGKVSLNDIAGRTYEKDYIDEIAIAASVGTAAKLPIPDGWGTVTTTTDAKDRTVYYISNPYFSIKCRKGTLVLSSIMGMNVDISVDGRIIAKFDDDGNCRDRGDSSLTLEKISTGLYNLKYQFREISTVACVGTTTEFTSPLQFNFNRNNSYILDFTSFVGEPIPLSFPNSLKWIQNSFATKGQYYFVLPSQKIADATLKVEFFPRFSMLCYATDGSRFAYQFRSTSPSGTKVSISPTQHMFEEQEDGSYNIKFDLAMQEFVSVSYSLDKYSYVLDPEQTARSGGGNTVLRNATGVDDPTAAAKSATTAACTKLKEAYGSNIRIYVVKYRKSSGDYAYLDTCATSTGGKSYDISDSAALKTTLDTIAADLKSWAGYTEARVVN